MLKADDDPDDHLSMAERQLSQPPLAPAVAAGWYAEGCQPGYLRYWDGQVWTDHWHRIGDDQVLQQTAVLPSSEAPMNTMAVLSLVFVVVSLFTSLLTAPVVVVMGHISLSQIRRRGERGRRLAITGLVLGYIMCLILLALILLFGFIAWVFLRYLMYDESAVAAAVGVAAALV